MSLRPALAMTAVAIAAAATLPLGSAPAAPGGSFQLQSRLETKSLHQTDTKPKGHSVGDVFVFSANLRRDGSVAGRAEYVQTLVDGRYSGVLMNVSLLLADGRLELQGAGLDKRAPGTQKERDTGDLAIIGGTGAYAGASGTVHVVDLSETTQRLEVSLGT